MNAEFSIEIRALREQLKKLNSAIDTFEPYSKDFIKNTQDSLEGFNSDFVSEVKWTLDSMSDTKAPELIKDLKSYSQMVEKAVEAFDEVDQAYAKEAERIG